MRVSPGSPSSAGVYVASIRRAALTTAFPLSTNIRPWLGRTSGPLRSGLGFRVALNVAGTGSGSQIDRPAFKPVLEAAPRGKIDALLVYKLDRAGTSALDLLANIRELVEIHGVRFVVTSQGLDLKPGGDAMSRLLMTVLAAVAEFERDLIRDRTRLELTAARRRGVRLGRRPKEGPFAGAVLARRAVGENWTKIAQALRCSVGKARRVAAAADPSVRPRG